MTGVFVVVLLLVIWLVIIMIGCFLLGRKTAKNPDSYLRRHPAVAKGMLFGYIIFAGCFVFPIRSEPFPLDFMKIYLLVASYGIVGLGFAGIYGEKKHKLVYLSAFALTMVGMLCRYLLEYGEVSNIYNFTVFNMVSFIVLIPLFTVLAYDFWMKYLVRKK